MYIPNSSTLYTQALQMKIDENQSFEFVPQNQGGYQQSAGSGRSFDTNNHSVEYWTRAVTSQFTHQDRVSYRNNRIIPVWLEDTLGPKPDEYSSPMDYLIRRCQRFSSLLNRVVRPISTTRRKRKSGTEESTLKQRKEAMKEWEKWLNKQVEMTASVAEVDELHEENEDLIGNLPELDEDFFIEDISEILGNVWEQASFPILYLRTYTHTNTFKLYTIIFVR